MNGGWLTGNPPPTRSTGELHPVLSGKHVVMVGAGGLGCPAALVLARSGVGRITLLDDDRVEWSNLHRQTLFRVEDQGLAKAQVATRRLCEEAAAAGWQVEVAAQEQRVLPDNVLDLLRDADLVLEGADNFATKFLVADACCLLKVPVVQAGAVRWVGWSMASLSMPGSPCLRCVFEDVPRGPQATCADAGVVGPVVGVMGSLQAALTLRLLHGDPRAAGQLWSYRALEGQLRSRHVSPRSDCALCSGLISDIKLNRYLAPECAA